MVHSFGDASFTFGDLGANTEYTIIVRRPGDGLYNALEAVKLSETTGAVDHSTAPVPHQS